MATKTKTQTQKKSNSKNDQVGTFIGELYAFNVSLKLFHWHVTGPSSYAQHMALDQAIDSLSETLDSIAETTYAMMGDINVVVPEVKIPNNIVKHAQGFYDHVEDNRSLFTESFSDSLLDDFQEGVQQLLYRLTRLS